MEKTHSLKLVDGTFSATEAENVLSTLISYKINFHSMESFSNKERFNKDVSHHEKRISELKEARKYLDFIINEAKEHKKVLVVESNINITFQ